MVGRFHGARLVKDAPDSPPLAIAGSTAAFAFGHADQDPSMPREAVDAREETLLVAGQPCVNEVYAGAAPATRWPTRRCTTRGWAERHYRVLEELFARTLG